MSNSIEATSERNRNDTRTQSNWTRSEWDSNTIGIL